MKIKIKKLEITVWWVVKVNHLHFRYPSLSQARFQYFCNAHQKSRWIYPVLQW